MTRRAGGGEWSLFSAERYLVLRLGTQFTSYVFLGESLHLAAASKSLWVGSVPMCPIEQIAKPRLWTEKSFLDHCISLSSHNTGPTGAARALW